MKIRISWLAALLILAVLAGCAQTPGQPPAGTPAVTYAAPETAAPLEPTAPPAEMTATDQPTLEQPPAVDEPQGGGQSTQPAQPPAGATPAPNVAVTPLVEEAEMVLIALEDDGASGEAVGCGDSAIPVSLGPAPEGVDAALFAAESLLALDGDYFGESGLYNALHQSELAVDSLGYEDGALVLRLSGQLMLGGVCDDPRVQAQLEGTLLRSSAAQAVRVLVNGQPLDELLSEK